MEQKILNKNQIKFLEVFAKEKELAQKFYLSGGTALAAFYISYRLSEDLDFFCEEEFDPQAIIVFFKKYKKELEFKEFDYQKSFNRNLYFLKFNSHILKTEFTYYPFKQIEKPKVMAGIKIDSLLDIAVNKIFTIFQNPRTRDFIDLYLIIKERDFDFFHLIKKARIKFDWHIDPIQLGAQLMKANELKDYPILIKKIDDSRWQSFYEKIAKKLGEKI
ncbi:MAG: nucleotidyl transferase AbiEii/AbiGii toxin family protein [bacterium]|nr:nucleotidyl transferase AbiEii/AbiGii toxin family protein [bacterium]